MSLKRIFEYIPAILLYRQRIPKTALIVSYPKSGSTWFRLIWFQYLVRAGYLDCEISFKNLDTFLPSVGSPYFKNKYNINFKTLISTHLNYKSVLQHPKTILLTRDPRDVLVSYFHYLNAKTNQPSFETLYDLAVDKKYGLEAWFKHYKSWKNRAAIVITYEELKENDQQTVRGVFKKLAIDYNDEILTTAVEESRFDKFRDIEKTKGHSKPKSKDKEFNFTRKGIVGDYKNNFDERLNALYIELCKKYNCEIYN